MVLRGVAVGLAFGVLTSILPLELVMVGPAALAAFVIVRVQRARQERNARMLLLPAVAGAVAVLVAAFAATLPFKYVDRTHLSLDAQCVTVGRVAIAARSRAEALGQDALQQQVCFATAQPSLREVAAALESQAGVVMKHGYCGNGASLLWGASPIGAPRFAQVTR